MSLCRITMLYCHLWHSYQKSFQKMAKKSESKVSITSLAETRRFVVSCLMAAGAPRTHAEIVAEVLSEADYKGHIHHGLSTLEKHIKDIRSGLCDAKATPKIIKETPSTAWVDGQNGLGAVIGYFCMDLAIKKAKTTGVGWVVAKGSNHYGIAEVYSIQALKAGLIGLSFSNTSPLMAPTRAKTAALGSNPISCAAPGHHNDSFILDMATTAVTLGKIEQQKRKKEPLPEGWALNAHGQIETDPETALRAGRLLPLGGMEITGGYKGTGLAMLVEVLCGISAGSHYGPNVRRWGDSNRPADLGQCFAAVDPNCFAPDFQGRLSDLLSIIKNLVPADPNKPVLVPGDPEKAFMANADEVGGVHYPHDVRNMCDKLAKECNVTPLTYINK